MTAPLGLEAYVIDGAGINRGTLTYAKLDAILRWRGVGTWNLNISHLTDAAWSLTEPGAAIVVRSGSLTVFSGPLTGGRVQSDRGRRAGIIQARGVTDEIVLADRRAWPVPTSPATSQLAASHDRRSGKASTVILGYVNANAGPSARVERRAAGFTTGGDALLGTNVIGAARFANLLELITDLAVAGGDLGFDVRRGVNTGRVFRIYQPRDLTAGGRFSFELGNVSELDYAIEAPTATTVIGGGQGDLTARAFVEATDTTLSARWRRRVEAFHDDRSEGDPAKLQQDVTTKLAEAGETGSAKITPIDSPTLRYGTHYGLGDRITVEAAAGRRIAGIIREVEVADDATSGVRYQPRVGDPGATATDAATIALMRAQRDLRSLETGK